MHRVLEGERARAAAIGNGESVPALAAPPVGCDFPQPLRKSCGAAMRPLSQK